MNKPELLLPAGKFEALKAAVANGADAVYLSGVSYGARAGAGNFNDEEMKKALMLCHSCGVKVYVTMNTLLKDDEVAAALDYVKFLYDLGTDALIVQDMALAGAVKKLLPAFALHGSTQMTIHNVHTAQWAYEFGLKRVILAREMTLEEIRKIHEAVPKLELEVFAHGAICICYSGQCLMSSLIGGRSGNRGYCAQPCRLAYQLWDDYYGCLSGEPSHLLSPKDLNTLNDLKELAEAGVSGFKIEGRMRRPEYVASVGKAYRNALDAIDDDGAISPLDEAMVEQVFNREFTQAYLHGNIGADMMSYNRPNNRGVLLGRVKSVNGKVVTLELTKELSIGDGIEVWVKVGGRVGCTVSDIRVNKTKVSKAYPGQEAEINLPGRIAKGDRVFKTYDSLLMSAAAASYENFVEDIPLSFKVKAEIGKPLYVAAKDALGHEVEAQPGYIVEKAQKTPTDEAMIKKQLSRLGGSGYSLAAVEVEAGDAIIIPVSILNRARRDIVDKLTQEIFNRYPKVTNHCYVEAKNRYLTVTKEKKKRNVPKLSVKVRDIYQAQAAVEAGAEEIIFAPHFGLEPMKDEDWRVLKALNEKYPELLIFALPRVCQDSKFKTLDNDIKKALAMCLTRFMVGQTGDIYLKNEYPEIEGFFGEFSQNVLNKYAAKELYDLGFTSVTASLELTAEGLSALSTTAGDKSVIVHGPLPMMISRHCLIGAALGKDKNKVPCGAPCFGRPLYLKDRMSMLFPVLGDKYHNFYVYNCRELALIDELNSLTHFQTWRIEGQFYDIGSLKEIISLYLTGREQVLSKGEYQKELLLTELKSYSRQGFTKGHFYRGVK
ncbi:MAG: DUF3656 domain-containing protein [Bacillota bacterium]|nr:DUF3656 domain-containing protein [Bacillota bacterium]